MSETKNIKKHLVSLLSGRGAHIPFEAAVEGFPVELAGKRVPNLDHTAWQLVYHLRIAQWDILEFSRRDDHISPEYPSGYWSDNDGPGTEKEWFDTIALFNSELEEMIALVKDPAADLFTPFPYGSGQNLLKESLVLADHNSYHIGQLVDIRMLLGVPVRDW